MRRCMAVGGTDFGRYDRICARLQEVNFVFAATADMPRASSSRMQNSLWTMQISFVSISPGSKTRIFLGWPQRCQYRQDGCCLSRYCTAKRKCKKRTGLDFSSPVLIVLIIEVSKVTAIFLAYSWCWLQQRGNNNSNDNAQNIDPIYSEGDFRSCTNR